MAQTAKLVSPLPKFNALSKIFRNFNKALFLQFNSQLLLQLKNHTTNKIQLQKNCTQKSSQSNKQLHLHRIEEHFATKNFLTIAWYAIIHIKQLKAQKSCTV